MRRTSVSALFLGLATLAAAGNPTPGVLIPCGGFVHEACPPGSVCVQDTPNCPDCPGF